MTIENKSKTDSSLETILQKVGDFGKYQIYVFSLVCLAVALHSAVHVAYVFTAMDVPYRCEIPNCDSENPQYSPSWLPNAVPYPHNRPSKCQMYQPFTNESVGFENNCTAGSFNRKSILKCSDFVYGGPEWTILHEYNLQCDENLWKLALVGTMNNVGQFFGLLVSGVISDRYGRKKCLVWGMVLCSICGLIRTLMPSYEWFLVLEFLDAAFGSGSYICGFILAVELVGPKKRVLSGTLISSTYVVGEVFVALAAYFTQSWKPTIYIVYTPSLLFISYLWLIPESIRWNLSKGHTEAAKKTLKKLAAVNKKELTDKELETLNYVELTETDITPKNDASLFMEALRSSVLMLRLFACCFCWITCTFLFYGLTLSSVALAGNAYLDFILTALVEIPAYFSCNFIVERYGRKNTLVSSYLLTGVACLLFTFVPSSSRWGSLCVYLIGKFGATASFTILYVITSEMFPTNLRNSFMGTCSTLGRCGSMLSPQTPLLAQIWEPLPLIMFAFMSVVAGFLTLTFPETLNKKLPDTVQEAENIKNAPDITMSLKTYENNGFQEDFKHF